MASASAAGTSGTKESSLTTLISFLDSRNIPSFYQVMTKTAVTQIVLGPVAYALGFPVCFVRAHGTNIGELTTFQPTNCDRTWPIKITKKDEPLLKHRVFAYMPGSWIAFVVDNGIQVGDTLVFSLVGVSRFMIDIIKASPPAEAHEEEAHEEEDPSLDRSIVITRKHPGGMGAVQELQDSDSAASDSEGRHIHRYQSIGCSSRLLGVLSRHAAIPMLGIERSEWGLL